MFVLSQRSLKNLEGVKPELVKVVKRAIEITPVDFCVTCGLRTKEQQQALFDQGRTKPGPIVTWTLNSRHLTGEAVDLAAIVKGQVTWDLTYYGIISQAMKRAASDLGIDIECGYDWVKKDAPHFQLLRRDE